MRFDAQPHLVGELLELIHPDNLRSRRATEKIGATLAEVTRRGMCVYRLTRTRRP